MNLLILLSFTITSSSNISLGLARICHFRYSSQEYSALYITKSSQVSECFATATTSYSFHL